MRIISIAAMLAACNAVTSVQIEGDPNATTGEFGTETTTDTTSTTTPSTPTTGALVYDCDALPTGVLGFQQLTAPRGYHDLKFDALGNMLGANTANDAALMKSSPAGDTTLLVPPYDTIQQMAWLLDGDLAVAGDSSGIQRVDPVTGGRTAINNNIRPYGLIMGPDDLLWAADEERIWRLDPDTGDAELILERGSLTRGNPRVIGFNLTYDKLYMGTRDGTQGRVYVLDLDANYNPVGEPREFASGVGGGGWGPAGEYHDTMGIDICGNLYVADFWSSNLSRIDPYGNVTEIASWPFDMNGMGYGHGMVWGTGQDGWNDHSIYMSQPYQDYNVIELDLGVPGRDWAGGYAINIPTP